MANSKPECICDSFVHRDCPACFPSKPAESPKAAEPAELPEMDVNRDATEEDRAAAYRFMRDCEELLPDRKNMLAMIEKLRLEQLIRERQWNTRATPAPDPKVEEIRRFCEENERMDFTYSVIATQYLRYLLSKLDGKEQR